MAIATFTKENFAQEVENASRPVLVDFWAPWCGYCRMISPVLDQVERDHGEKVAFGKVNVDEQKELAERFSIMTLPTLLLFRDGKPGEPLIGGQSRFAIEEWLRAQGAI